MTGEAEIQDFEVDVIEYFPGDADNDGDLDILALGAHESVLMINNNNTFVPVASGIPDDYYNMAAWGDFDSDGDLDISIGGRTQAPGRVYLYENTGGLFISNSYIDIGGSNRELGWADLDNDGDMDLVAGDAVYYQDEGVFTRENVYLPLFFQNLTLLDIDGDHDIDFSYNSALLLNQVSTLNEPPSPPALLEAVILNDGSGIRLSWDTGSDDTTPAEALSYNLSIGDASMANNVLSPSSNY